MDEATKAYVAGIVDGEGYVCIAKAVNGRPCPQVRVRMSHEETIRFVKRAANAGTFYQDKPKKGNHNYKLLYVFSIRGVNAVGFLKEIYPFLITKKEEAKKVIDFDYP